MLRCPQCSVVAKTPTPRNISCQLRFLGFSDNGKENGNYYIIIGYILGLYRDNGKENGNYYSRIGYILGLYRDNGKENGNYYIINMKFSDHHPFLHFLFSLAG